jgi:predicted nucleotidyltransferase
VESLRSVLADASLIRLALLFGSRARDAGRPDSDVDVGIIPRDPALPLTAELDLHARLERACEAAVDLVRLDRASTLLRWEVARNSVVLVAHPAAEVARFVAAAAIEHADLMTTLGPAVERFRRALARGCPGPAGTSRR